ncbi:hypothetical protein [Nocardioides sp.]
MAHPKRNLFAVLGWIVWKLLALVGLPMAKKKVQENRSGRRHSRR